MDTTPSGPPDADTAACRSRSDRPPASGDFRTRAHGELHQLRAGIHAFSAPCDSFYAKSLYDPRMRRTRVSARWMRLAPAFSLALGLAVVSASAQRPTILTNGRNLQIPINHGLPDQPRGFTFCRLRYENIRRARKSGWG